LYDFCGKHARVLVLVEFYRAAGDEADVPDKLELSFRVGDKPVQLRLERSDSIPTNTPVIVARDNRHTYWSRKPGSVNASLLFIIHLFIYLIYQSTA